MATVDHDMISKVSLPDLGAPEKGTAESKKIPDDKITYSSAKSLGADMPDLTSLKFVSGELPRAKEPVAVLFWAKYAKGDYRTMVHFSYLMRALPKLQIIGVSCDADLADCEAMMKKKGTPMPTQSIDELLFDFPLAFDEGRKVKNAFGKIAYPSPAPGFAYLFDAAGKCVWAETFTSSWALKQGQFAEQCALLLANKPLLDNGPRPDDDEDADDEEAVTTDVGDLSLGDY